MTRSTRTHIGGRSAGADDSLAWGKYVEGLAPVGERRACVRDGRRADGDHGRLARRADVRGVRIGVAGSNLCATTPS